MNTTTTHFVGRLTINKVERTKNDDRASANHGAVSDRVVDESASLTIKADNLETLVAKLQRHIDIIEEG